MCLVWSIGGGVRVDGTGTGGRVSKDKMLERIEVLLRETNPEKRLALSRKLRAEVWELLSEDDLESLGRKGFDITKLRGALRQID